jgi:hypothetical protein
MGKIDSLTIESCLTESFYVPTSLTGGFIKPSSNNILKNLTFLETDLVLSIDDFTPLVPLAQIYAGNTWIQT